MSAVRLLAAVALACAGAATALVVGCTALPTATTAPADGDFLAATVVRVVDGDTAVFMLESGAEEKTRFIGVDTPESTNSIEAYGKEAAAYTAGVLTPGRRVYLEQDVEERDRYGRLLAYVWLEEPSAISDAEVRAKMFNAHLALEGYAQQMTIQPNSRYAELFTRYVREAREDERGLWAPGSAGEDAGTSRDAGGGSAAEGSPSAAGSGSPSSPSIGGAYVGNRNTHVFHRPECSSVTAMKAGNRVGLSSRDRATGDGYRPCGRCDP